MGYEYSNDVSRNGITRQEFEQKLDKQLEKMNDKKQAEYKEKATSIFNKFAGLNGDENVLDESEQIQARAALQALDNNENGKIGKRELSKGDKGSDVQKVFAEAGYKAAKFFMNAIGESILDDSEEDIGDVQYGAEDENGESDVTVHYDQSTPTIKDDGLTSYHLDDENRIVEKAVIKENENDIYEDNPENDYEIDDVVDRKTKGLPPEDATPVIEEQVVNSVPIAPTPATDEQIKSGFFQYLTQDVNFTGKLKNNESMQLPAGCEIVQGVGIKFDNQIYKMRGEQGNNDNPLRFECDETQKTLQQVLTERKSDDSVHRYYNHGEAVNEQSTYDATTGKITHKGDETAVAQTQTFASMLMNNAEDSTLRFDAQRGKNGTTITTGQTILDTIDTNDDGIDMQELISYLNAAKNESIAVKNKTGARKYAGGVDIDAKDLANIGKVFKQFAGEDGKLQAGELDKLLAALKSSSMTKLAKGDDKYLGEQKVEPEKTPSKTEPPKTDPPKAEEPVVREGNRERKVKDNANDKGHGEKQEYYYNDGVRTALEDAKVKDADGKEKEVKVEDNDGNIAQAGHSSLFKKRFIYIEDLEKEVNAKVLERTVDGKEDQQIVRAKDKDGEKSYYQVITQDDGSYKLGEELVVKSTKGKNKFVTKSAFQKEMKKQLGLPEDVKIPSTITGEYNNKGRIEFKLNGGKCSPNIAKVYITRHNTQLGAKIPDENQTIEIEKKEVEKPKENKNKEIQDIPSPQPENDKDVKGKPSSEENLVMDKKAVITDEFRNKIKSMETGVLSDVSFKISPNGSGGYSFDLIENANVSLIASDFLNIEHPLLKDGKGVYKKYNITSSDLNKINMRYTFLKSQLAMRQAVYNQLAKKPEAELTKEEKLFMQNHEQRMHHFLSSAKQNTVK